MTSNLSFQSTLPTLIFSFIAVAITVGVCWSAWSRSRYARGTGYLEALRLAMVILVAVTLNQPEWLQEFRPEEDPTLVVLWDGSGSMATQDVLNEEQPADPPKTREDWVKPLLTEEQWQLVGSNVEVVFETFASTDGETNGTDLHTALIGILQRHDNLRGVVLLSDGDWNQGEPPAGAATQMRMKNVPVFAVSVGSRTRLPDVEVASLDAPTFGVAGKTMRIPFTIRSSLPRDFETTVTLKSSDGGEDSMQVLIPAMGQLSEALSWLPENTGDFQLTLEIPEHETERLKKNNSQTAPIAIRREALKVLLIESFPRWEFRYVRNALERDPGVEVSSLMFHPGLSKVGGGRGYLKEFPDSREKLQEYDVIMLGDVGIGDGQLKPEQCKLIKGLIKNQASGLILMPGLKGYQQSLFSTDLEDLFPILFDKAQPRGWGSRVPSHFELTESGRKSLLARLAEPADANARLWESLPGFQWYAPVLRTRAGAETLAVHKTESNRFGRIPLLVTRTYGTGKILFMGTDGAWRWREGVEDLYHYRFWGQVARWMAYQRNMAEGEAMRLFYSPDRPATGDVVTLNANVMSTGGAPLREGHVVVQLMTPTGETETVRLTAQGEDSWGLFSGRFTPEKPGEYQLMMTCRENGATLQTKLAVQGVSREKLGQPARYDVLEEISSITRGRLVAAGDLSGIQKEIAQLPDPEPTVRRLRIWCHPLWGGLIVLLLGVFWTGRKLVGVI